MGKIQTVICPQCGSTNLTALGDDKFRCENCHATYFIDKEKVEVHVKHSFEPQKQTAQPVIDQSSLKKILGIFIAVIALLAMAVIVFNFLSFKKNTTKPGYETFGDNNESADFIKVALSNNQPKLFVLSETTKRDGTSHAVSDTKIALKMYQPETRKPEKELELVPSTKEAGLEVNAKSESQMLVIGKMIWYVVGKAKIYGVDPDSFEIRQTNQSITAQFKELASGIGNVESIAYEKGFKIQNNNGKSYFYFPLENKLYDEDGYNKAKDGIAGKASVKRFTFEKIDHGGTDSVKKLYQIKRFESETGPGQRCVECAYFELEDSKAGKALSSKSEITEVRGFTPERNYFNGQYLYNDDNELLIAFKRTANEKDAPVIQCLDADGNTRWTVETKSLSEKTGVEYSQYTSNVFKANDVYYLSDNYYATAIDDKDGKVLWSYNILNRDNWK